jgi:lipid-A-disaccharide synthase
MLIAGEPSGDTLAAELVQALRARFTAVERVCSKDLQPLRTGLEPRFFGAGGARMKAAGVDLAFDMTRHSVIGLPDALRNYFKFRALFNELYRLALARQPDAIICVDFAGFNRRFAKAVRNHTRRRTGWFHDWQPRIIQYVSPQVWASREGRARQIARDYDLLLSIFPFEKDWYTKRVPGFRVECVGHPLVDRFQRPEVKAEKPARSSDAPRILLLPGSRSSELRHHLPTLLGALKLLRNSLPELRTQMVLPDERLAQQAKSMGVPPGLEIQTGGLPEALSRTDVAIASTGTVTMECAFFRVPTVTLYKASWLSYLLAKQIVKVKSLTMPNLLANEEVFPEFIQAAATPEAISRAALELLRDQSRRTGIKRRLDAIIGGLGNPGVNGRAAALIIQLLENRLAAV